MKIRQTIPGQLLRPETRSRSPNSLNLFRNSNHRPKKLKAEGGVDKILAAARAVPTQLGKDPTHHGPDTHFQKLKLYEKVPLPTDAIDLGYGIGVMRRIPCAAKALATPY